MSFVECGLFLVQFRISLELKIIDSRMSDTSFNPYASPEANCVATTPEPLAPSRSGLLLLVTLIQITVEAMCFAVLCFMIFGFLVMFIRGYEKSESLEIFVSFVVTCVFAAFFFFLLRAECRNVRPTRNKERNILLATLSLTILPIAAGCWMLCDSRVQLSLEHFDVAGIWFGVAIGWIMLVGVRCLLHSRAAALAT